MANKADVSSAAKPNKTTMPGTPRMPQTAARAATKAPIALTAVTAMATGSEGVGSEESAAAVVATQFPVTDDAAAARPASGKSYGVKARSEQGRKNKNARNRARRTERAEEQTGTPDTVPPETEA